jgi:hypothetical protein
MTTTPEYTNAVLIQVGRNMKALLGWSDERIKAALRKADRHGQASTLSNPRYE